MADVDIDPMSPSKPRHARAKVGADPAGARRRSGWRAVNAGTVVAAVGALVATTVGTAALAQSPSPDAGSTPAAGQGLPAKSQETGSLRPPDTKPSFAPRPQSTKDQSKKKQAREEQDSNKDRARDKDRNGEPLPTAAPPSSGGNGASTTKSSAAGGAKAKDRDSAPSKKNGGQPQPTKPPAPTKSGQPKPSPTPVPDPTPEPDPTKSSGS